MALSFGAFANECLVSGPKGGDILAKLNTTDGIVVVNSVYNSHVSIGISDKSFASYTFEIYKLMGDEHKLVKIIKQRSRTLTPNAARKLGAENDNEIVNAIKVACEGAQPITEMRIEFPRVAGQILSTHSSSIKDVPSAFCELNNFKFAKSFVESSAFYKNVQTLPYTGWGSGAEIGVAYKEIICVN